MAVDKPERPWAVRRRCRNDADADAVHRRPFAGHQIVYVNQSFLELPDSANRTRLACRSTACLPTRPSARVRRRSPPDPRARSTVLPARRPHAIRCRGPIVAGVRQGWRAPAIFRVPDRLDRTCETALERPPPRGRDLPPRGRGSLPFPKAPSTVSPLPTPPMRIWSIVADWSGDASRTYSRSLPSRDLSTCWTRFTPPGNASSETMRQSA